MLWPTKRPTATAISRGLAKMRQRRSLLLRFFPTLPLFFLYVVAVSRKAREEKEREGPLGAGGASDKWFLKTREKR